MTREETIKILNDEEIASLVGKFHGGKEALDLAIAALRPVSREQVEKVWRGEWGRYCFSDDSHGYQCKNCGVQLDDPVYYRSFCPRCGKAMTDEAVDMMLERWKEAFDENT